MQQLVFVLGLIAVVISSIPNRAIAETTGSSSSVPRDDLGFSIGTPVGLNLEWEHVSSSTTLALSGMYFGNTRGIQLGISPSFMRRGDNKLRLQVIAGSLRIKLKNEAPEHRSDIGAEGVWRPKRFLLAMGLTVGTGTFSNPQVNARIGFVWSVSETAVGEAIGLTALPSTANADEEWYIGPRIGLLYGIGPLALEVQHLHFGVTAGYVLPRGAFVAFRYYFDPHDDSWAMGPFFWYRDGNTMETSMVGFGAKYRWRFDSGLEFALGAGVGPGREQEQGFNTRKFIFLVPTITFGVSF